MFIDSNTLNCLNSYVNKRRAFFDEDHRCARDNGGDPVGSTLRYAQGVHPGRLIRTLVEVNTDEGVTGLGEIGGSGASSDALIAALRDRVLGHDPMGSERLRWVAYNPVEGAFYEDLTQGFAAVEFACLDIQGKVTGGPVHELLGGAVRPRIEFAAYIFFRYATDSAGPVATPDQVVEPCPGAGNGVRIRDHQGQGRRVPAGA